jgi:hypothetical protein
MEETGAAASACIEGHRCGPAFDRRRGSKEAAAVSTAFSAVIRVTSQTWAPGDSNPDACEFPSSLQMRPLPECAQFAPLPLAGMQLRKL